MERRSVKSSNIASIGYDEALQLLEIEFNTGAVYQYKGVVKEIYEALMTAKSHGIYFNSMIKNVYAFSQIKK
jgi:hypothetical protein